METNPIPCACGCGGLLEPTDKRGRPRKFLPSHWSRVQPNQRQTVLCRNCSAPIERAQWHLKRVENQFCGHTCEGEWSRKTGRRRGEQNGHYNTITVECAGCGTPVSKAESLIRRRNHRVYCPKCQMPKKPDRTSWADYPPEFSKALRHQVRERDGFACVLCAAAPKAKKAHQIHHVDNDKTNNDPRNLVTLCNRCHGQTLFAREVWTAKLQALVSERYPG